MRSGWSRGQRRGWPDGVPVGRCEWLAVPAGCCSASGHSRLDHGTTEAAWYSTGDLRPCGRGCGRLQRTLGPCTRTRYDRHRSVDHTLPHRVLRTPSEVAAGINDFRARRRAVRICRRSKDLSEEFLNLASRRQLPVWPIVAGKQTHESLEGLKALVDHRKGTVKRELEQFFLKSGGMIVLPPGGMANEAISDPKPVAHDTGYTLYRILNGAVAVSPEGVGRSVPPHAGCSSTHRQIKYVVRLYNAGSSIAYPVVGRKRGRLCTS